MTSGMCKRWMASLAAFAAGFALLAPCACAAADNPHRWESLADPIFQNLEMGHEMPAVIIMNLVQDEEGFVWLGTQGGLYRWDGYRYRAYRLTLGGGLDTPFGMIQTFLLGKDGSLWVGSASTGLARYDRTRDAFISVAGLNNTSVSALAEDGRGGLWVGTPDGLLHYAPASGEKHYLKHADGDAASLPDNNVTALLAGSGGRLWVGTSGGLAYRGSDPADAAGFAVADLPWIKANERSVTTLKESRDGRLWIGSQHGIYMISGGRVTALVEQRKRATGPIEDWISTIVEDNDQKIWVGTFGEGIIEIDESSLAMRRIRNDLRLPTSLLHDFTTCAMLDRSGLLWVSSNRGVSILRPEQNGVLSILGASSRPNGLANGDILSVLQTRKDRIWLGLLNDGIDLINPETGVVDSKLGRELGYGIAERANDARPQVTAIAELPGGAVYLGTDNGLYVVDAQEQHLRRYVWPGRNPSDRVQVLLPERDTLWIGGFLDGMWMLDLRDKNAVPVRPAWAGELSDKRVLDMKTSHDGNTLWIATQNGLNAYDRKSGRMERILPDPADPQSLSSGSVATLLVDREDRLWVGTFDGGLNVALGRDQRGHIRFKHIGTAEGLPHANVDMALEDKDGNVWISTDSGLAHIDTKTFVVQALQVADGAVITNYYVNSGARTGENEFIFGGLGGLTVIKPDQYREWAYRPPVLVTEIRVQGKRVPTGRFNHAAIASAAIAPLEVESAANSFAVEFAALDFSAPERNSYSYKLEGYDNNWIDADATRRQAAYTNLPPGDYKLRLRGSNRSGVWTEQELTLPIRVLPAWYQTWWVRAIGAAVALALVALVVQSRTRFLRMRQLELEQQVKDRTFELVAQRDLLELQKLAVEREKIAVENQKDIAENQRALVVAAHNNIALLSEIGRQITATLDFDEVMAMIYRQVAELMDTGCFAIGVYDDARHAVDFRFVMQEGRRVPTTGNGGPADELALWCASHKTEVFINDLEREYAGYFKDVPWAGELQGFASLIYVPVHLKGRIMGVIAVKSARSGAYTRVHMDMLVTLASYTAIALDNAVAYRKLGEAMRSLKEAQQQLVLQEKMASLGTLTSGVAHEINNPTNFAHAGATALCIELEKFKQQLLEMASGDDSEIRQFLSAKFADLVEQVDTIVEGTSRIRDLVKDLSTFSRLGEADWKKVPICSSLLATVNLVRTQFSDVVNIQCDFTENPVLECRPAQLNQVFMNLIVNACQAIESRQKKTGDMTPGVLNIRSRIEERELVIEFEDDGCGIPAAIVDRIFEPFFTTKDVGQGTGLGLSISFGIVEDHRGRIVVHSVEGVGSCFTVRLPMGDAAQDETLWAESENHR